MIERTSSVPLYTQLKHILLERIRTAEWPPGALIPSERELQNQYQLSRTTVRQTLNELVQEGYLHRQRGRGTFVTKRPFVPQATQSMEVDEYLTTAEITLSWVILQASFVKAASDIYQRLQIEVGARLYCLHRLRLANGAPIGYHLAYLPEWMVPHMDQDAFSQRQSLTYLHQTPQMRQSVAHFTISAMAAAEPAVTLLEMRQEMPLLCVERLITTEGGIPIEFLQAVYRSDKFTYHITSG